MLKASFTVHYFWPCNSQIRQATIYTVEVRALEKAQASNFIICTVTSGHHITDTEYNITVTAKYNHSMMVSDTVIARTETGELSTSIAVLDNMQCVAVHIYTKRLSSYLCRHIYNFRWIYIAVIHSQRSRRQYNI